MNRICLIVSVVLLMGLFAAPVWAQDADYYTRSELWEVSRQNWDRFIADFERTDKPALEKMFAEGKISEWGVESFSIHLPGEYTHGYFYSADGMGALTSAGRAWGEAIEEAGFTEHEFAPLVVSHRDQIFRNMRMRATGGTYKDAFAFFSEFHVEWGQSSAYTELWEEVVQPRMEELRQAGKIIAYGLIAEEISTRETTWRLSWYIAPSAEGYDAASESWRAMWSGMSEDDQQALFDRYRSVVQEETAREGTSTLLYYQVKDR